MEMVRQDLLEHVGGTPSVPQRMLIERAAVLTLRLAMMDEKILKDPNLRECDSNHAIAWTNALTRTLVALGVSPVAAARAPTLADHLASLAALSEETAA
jgi:hypothetical protein